jgi:hypothetical protein
MFLYESLLFISLVLANVCMTLGEHTVLPNLVRYVNVIYIYIYIYITILRIFRVEIL